MPAILQESRRPLDQNQRTELAKFFESPTFNLLKEVVAANCAVHQMEAMNRALYPDNEAMRETCEGARAEAIRLNSALDVLDGLAKSEQKWFTATIECRPK